MILKYCTDHLHAPYRNHSECLRLTVVLTCSRTVSWFGRSLSLCLPLLATAAVLSRLLFRIVAGLSHLQLIKLINPPALQTGPYTTILPVRSLQ
ncbi:hypothetical protein FQA47_015705 [Oryzias melastigma]|uniref:Uncharacterized protein n=1 Tax=Oryzias melastigma TaxID=30732 RepID=A0A834F7B7_ORYME|nr:hypothetical protein FQA47_015705 [Oryzias melastigma]